MIGELIGTLMAPLIFAGVLVLGLAIALLVRWLSASEEPMSLRSQPPTSAQRTADNELSKII